MVSEVSYDALSVIKSNWPLVVSLEYVMVDSHIYQNDTEGGS